MYINPDADIYLLSYAHGFSGITEDAVREFEWKIWNLVDRGLPFVSNRYQTFADLWPNFHAACEVSSLDDFNLAFVEPGWRNGNRFRFFKRYAVDSAYSGYDTYAMPYTFFASFLENKRQDFLYEFKDGSQLFLDIRDLQREQDHKTWKMLTMGLYHLARDPDFRLCTYSGESATLKDMIEQSRRVMDCDDFGDLISDLGMVQINVPQFVAKDGSPQPLEKIRDPDSREAIREYIDLAKLEQSKTVEEERF